MTEPSSTDAPQPTGDAPQPAADAPTGDAPTRDLAKELRAATAALAAERKAHGATQKSLDSLTTSSQTEAERAVAKARDEGRAEALKAAGMRLAAAEFRAAAAGKIADPAALIDHLDLSKFVTEDGEPDVEAIKAVVDKLGAAASAVKPTAPVIPNGPRPEPLDPDWIRQALKR